MQIWEILIYICLAAFAVASIVVGVLYNKSNNKTKAKEENLQEYVKSNLGTFGVCNKGTSMDERKIYLVPFSKIGY